MPVLCYQHHVLELRRTPPILGVHGPPVRPYTGRLLSLCKDRLYGEGHPGNQFYLKLGT